MSIMNRISNIIRSHRPAVFTPAGGNLLPELEKHLETLDAQIETSSVSHAVVKLEIQEWNTMANRIQEKKANTKDANKLASLNRLEKIAHQSIKEYEAKQEKLQNLKGAYELKERIQSAISMIEVENSLRHVTHLFSDSTTETETAISLEHETREIRRLLYTTESLMELTR